MKKPWLLCAVCGALAALLIVLLFSGSLDGTEREKTAARQLLLLAQDETGAFYMQLKLGAKDAAARGNAYLTSAAIGGQWTAENIDGALVLCGNDAARRAVLSRLAQAGVPCVVVASEDGEYRVVEDAAANAAALRARAGADGFSHPLEIGEGTALPSALSPYDCVLAFSASAARACAARNAAGEEKWPLYCVDTGEDRAEWIESGAARAMTMPAPYAMGYIAARNALGLAAGGKAEARAAVPARLVTLETLYAPENVKSAFPLLQ